MQDEFFWGTPPNTDYYFRFVISPERYTVDHFGLGAKVSYDSFMVGFDSLITRTKYQVLLSGPFGTVYAHTTYFYGPEYKGQSTEFMTVLYMNGAGSEPFQLIPALPTTDNLPLSAISVVRIFQAPPEFLVVSANYAPDGYLESLHVNGAKHGDWVHSNEVAALYPRLEVATMIGDRPQTREHFGLPSQFPIQRYPGSSDKIFAKGETKSMLDVVNLHYDRNRWVRQDSFLPDGSHSTRFLTYAVTEEEKILEPIDKTRTFGLFPYVHGSPKN
jgi:hypothetical protein